MSKYQKSLVEIEEIAYKQYEDACYNKTTKARAMEYERKLKNDTKILQDLVDRSTPMKPTISYSIVGEENSYCPNCVSRFPRPVAYARVAYKHCPNCGQAIDWSEEHEQSR